MSEKFTIGQASDETGLPESTIRYYDREFSDYLNIQRGKNNQRLFTEENFKDLEYIRYLLKREGLTVKEVKDKLGNQNKDDSPQEPEVTGSEASDNSELAEATTGGPFGEELENLRSDIQEISRELSDLEDSLTDLIKQIEKLEDGQQGLRELLDMNLERYNKLVEEFL